MAALHTSAKVEWCLLGEIWLEGRLQLAGGSRSNSAGNSFAELPEAWGGPPGVPVPPVPPDREEVVHMAATRVVMHQIVTPADVDQHGICPGGQVGGPARPCPVVLLNCPYFNLVD